MAIVVNTNMSSLVVQRNIFSSTNALTKSMQRLSTGMRINTAGDDAAGLSLSEKLKSNINASEVIKNNALTGVSLLQTAEGDLSVIHDNLQRMRDLAVQSANGVYSSSERKMLSAEFSNRMSEINRVAASSKFSDLNLLDGTLVNLSMDLQIGADAKAESRIDIKSIFSRVAASTIGISGANYLSNATITTATASRTSLDILDSAISAVSVRRSTIGATINRLNSTVQRIDVRKENLSSANSIIRDTDIASETATMTKQQILQQSGGILLRQANQSSQIAISLLQ